MRSQRGIVLVVSLVFLLLLSLLASSAMQNATLQEKMAGSQKQRNESFQMAENILRTAELSVQAPGFSLPKCATASECAAPSQVFDVSGIVTQSSSGATWVVSQGGFYALQLFAQTDDPVNTLHEDGRTWPLYRITAIGIQGTSRTVLEVIHNGGHRVMWRQRH